ncbi:uncharacterized protein LOC111472952 [Cucurbita maxima]|uniref:Uncharacterized protein LOC111472952 n=1 Tax=Cucurbita maxima TaxID=3661 RepID=A0A6J1IFV1_CUCMA|nr:uncharacterized protein LOC111472952 [Cucurbita maxima]
MAKIEEKLDRILNPVITPQDSSVNVVNNDDEVQEFVDEIVNEEGSVEILMNLKCPTLGAFRWYKDMYFNKVLIRTNSSLEFWKENFVNGLPKYFSRRIKDGLKTKYNGTIPWQTFSYESIVSFIIEGLRLCNESKIQNKLSSSISDKKELGRFCDQYGCKGIKAPSTSRRKKVKTYQKPYNSYRPREKYRSKPMQSQKPTYSKKRYTPTKTHRGKKRQACFKCREEGHYANKCPIKGKINELDIDQELKDQLL